MNTIERIQLYQVMAGELAVSKGLYEKGLMTKEEWIEAKDRFEEMCELKD